MLLALPQIHLSSLLSPFIVHSSSKKKSFLSPFEKTSRLNIREKKNQDTFLKMWLSWRWETSECWHKYKSTIFTRTNTLQFFHVLLHGFSTLEYIRLTWELVKTLIGRLFLHLTRPMPRILTVSLHWGQRICISNRFPVKLTLTRDHNLRISCI